MTALAVLPGPAAPPGKFVSALLALLMHLALALFLFYGIRWPAKPPEAVEVELVREMPAPPPPPEPPAPAVEAPAERPLPPPPVKPDIALKAKPEKPKPEKTPPKPPPKPVPKTEGVPKMDFSKQLQRDEFAVASNKSALAEEKAMARQKAEMSAQAVSKARGAWADKIAAKIKGNIVRPANAAGNPEVEFTVTLLPDGSVVGEPRLLRSSGNPALDAAIERAIRKSDPLPKPDDPSVFQRELRLKFRPLED